MSWQISGCFFFVACNHESICLKPKRTKMACVGVSKLKRTSNHACYL
uniref:Uncharacterized protein n=1 Tax=Rhizophora mucronata TaxID=61149 RepID=A0A2P2P8M0_RHIMU